MSLATADGLQSGVRLLDLTNVLAGLYCAHQAALLGADVIKVEVPGGDLARALGVEPALNRTGMGRAFWRRTRESGRWRWT